MQVCIKLSVHDLMASQLVCMSQGSMQHGGKNRNDTCNYSIAKVCVHI